MSWSIEAAGKKDDIKASIEQQAASYLATYKPGTPEGDDILAVKDRIMALIGQMQPRADLNGVRVSAYGSHSTEWDGGAPKGIAGASFSVMVDRVHVD